MDVGAFEPQVMPSNLKPIPFILWEVRMVVGSSNPFVGAIPISIVVGVHCFYGRGIFGGACFDFRNPCLICSVLNPIDELLTLIFMTKVDVVNVVVGACMPLESHPLGPVPAPAITQAVP